MKKKDLLVKKVLEIASEYTTKLTLRQLYYRLVVKGIIENKLNEYKYLSKILVNARMNGSVPFDLMEDRTREFVGGDNSETTPEDHFEKAVNYLKNCFKYFKLPRWKNQDYYVEVWQEKQALASLFQQITDKHNLILATCRGYPSLTFLHEAVLRLEMIDKKIVILYFGDFDGSGEDIYRYIQETLENFGITAEFIKVALNVDQIKKYDLPPAPAKRSDTRSIRHIEQFGDITVELDALEPNILQKLIHESISRWFDEEIHKQVLLEKEDKQNQIKSMIEEKDL